MMRQEITKIVIAVIMTGYLSKAMPDLPVKIEMLLMHPIFKMIFLGGLIYIKSGDAAVSALSVLVLYAVVYLLKMLMGEGFEAVDMKEIRHNEYYSNIGDKMTASESINSMMADITEKAADVKNYYLNQCQCNEKNSAKL